MKSAREMPWPMSVDASTISILSMVFAKSLDKTLFVHGARGRHGFSREKDGKIRPSREIRIPKVLNLDFAKAM